MLERWRTLEVQRRGWKDGAGRQAGDSGQRVHAVGASFVGVVLEGGGMVVFDGVHPPVLDPRPLGRPQGTDPHLFDGQDAPPLLGELLPRLGVRVEHREVGHDDRHGQGDGQHAGQGAQGADQHPHVRPGHHVPVSHGRHGDEGPPESLRDAGEVVDGIGLQTLGVVDERGEDDDAQDEEEDEQEQFFGTRLKRVDEDLQSPRMSCQFEQPEDADDAEEVEDVRIL